MLSTEEAATEMAAWPGAAPASLLAAGLTARRPEIPRPYRCTGYPWLPAIYVLVGAAWTLNTILTRPIQAFWGTAIVLIGVPAYLYWKRRKGRSSEIA